MLSIQYYIKCQHWPLALCTYPQWVLIGPSGPTRACEVHNELLVDSKTVLLLMIMLKTGLQTHFDKLLSQNLCEQVTKSADK